MLADFYIADGLSNPALLGGVATLAELAGAVKVTADFLLFGLKPNYEIEKKEYVDGVEISKQKTTVISFEKVQTYYPNSDTDIDDIYLTAVIDAKYLYVDLKDYKLKINGLVGLPRIYITDYSSEASRDDGIGGVYRVKFEAEVASD